VPYLFDLQKITKKETSEVSNKGNPCLELFVENLAEFSILLFGILCDATDTYLKSETKQKSDKLQKGAIKLIKKTYMKFNSTNSKTIIPFLLKQKYNLIPGALVVTISKNKFQEIIGNERVVRVLEPGDHLLYLGSVFDQKYNTIALKMLSGKTVLYFHKKKNIDWFVQDFGNLFEVVQKANTNIKR
jgi:hypothetical protein